MTGKNDRSRVEQGRRRVWHMMKRKEETHNIYKGQYWNRHIKGFQTWDEQKEWDKRFEQFCSRMWLDNEDENLTLPASGNRLSKQAYINKWENWLVKKFLETE